MKEGLLNYAACKCHPAPLMLPAITRCVIQACSTNVSGRPEKFRRREGELDGLRMCEMIARRTETDLTYRRTPLSACLAPSRHLRSVLETHLHVHTFLSTQSRTDPEPFLLNLTSRVLPSTSTKRQLEFDARQRPSP